MGDLDSNEIGGGGGDGGVVFFVGDDIYVGLEDTS